jgi:hypothetical protein
MNFHPMRLLALAALAVGSAAVFSAVGSAARQSQALSVPSGLQTFLSTPRASQLVSATTPAPGPGTPTFSRTPAFAWNPVRGATRYQFQLSTSNNFLADNALVWASETSSPTSSVPMALPWITGEPASLFWRVRAFGPDGLSEWSKPSAFDMRWTQEPRPLPAGPGYIRWTTVEGATGYQVWYVNAGGATGKTFTTITNVADEREYFESAALPSSLVLWRVRAERQVYGAAKNGLPTVSFGPWSRVFRSQNPVTKTSLPAKAEPVSTQNTGNPLDAKYVRLTPKAAVSDVVSTVGNPKLHSLVPAITVAGNPTTTRNLYRVYMFTDSDCVNRVFTGYPVASPAYAPRSFGGGTLAQGKHLMADGTQVVPTELPKGADGSTTGGASDSTNAGSSSSDSSGSATSGKGPAKIDLWDTRGRYYAVAVPVIQEVSKGATPPAAPPDASSLLDDSSQPDASSDTAAKASGVTYQDVELPQDACAKGRFITFGKASRTPVLTTRGNPTATGLSSSGRLLAAATSKPKFYGSPLVTWNPASGAVAYEVQWSKSAYPWRATGSIRTPATSATLPLTPGVWWYRVRGIDNALPGNGLMSWSAQVPLLITRPTLGVVNG